MNKQTKSTLLRPLKLGMLFCMALPAYANNIPENLSNWQAGLSTKNGVSNATFSMAVLTGEGENNSSPFKSEQSLNVVGDIRIAPEHVGENGVVYIVVQYNRQWFMKSASGWKLWDLQTENLVAYTASHPLLEVESPVVESKLSSLLGDFEIFLGYQVDNDLNYNQAPLKFKVIVSETNIPVGIGMNDTGITQGSVGADCAIGVSPEDCSIGRDAKARAGTLDKIGGGQAGFDFTKLDVNGSALDPQNVSWDQTGSEGANSQWSCVKDNVTGLVWEVKTDVGISNAITTTTNIHHKDNVYQWGGLTAIGTGFGVYSDEWNGLVSGSNNATLCGFNTGWRVPTKSELASITHKGIVGGLTIDINYFPNTQDAAYWSSSPVANDALNAWSIEFGNGIDGIGNGNDIQLERAGLTNYRVRLVH